MSDTSYRSLNAASIDGVTAPSNAIKNAFASENVNGWATYANTAQSTPVTGTGGSPTITLTRNTINPLRFASDFLITKGAANDQGQGVSYFFFLDNADLNKQVNISFDYKVSANFVTGTNSDIQVFIYDTIAATLIPLINNSNQILTSSGTFSGSFQSSTNQFYRLIFHIATTNASAYTFNFDNIQVNSSQVLPQGPIITDWSNALTFIPNAAFGTVTSPTYFSRRVGDEMQVKVSFTAGTATTSHMTIGLPAGYIIDNNKLSSAGSFLKGNALALSFSSQAINTSNEQCYPFFDGSDVSNVYFSGLTQSSTFVKAVGVNFVDDGQPWTAEFSIPIQGWTSGVASTSSSLLVMSQILTHGTQVTSTPTALGQYRSMYRATTNTQVLTDTTPNAGVISGANGIQIFSSAYNAAGTSGQPGKYEIFIGYNQTFNIQYYANTGRSGGLTTGYFSDLSTTDTGILTSYDPSTGVLILDALSCQSVSNTTRFVGETNVEGPGDNTNSNVTQGYFDVTVANNQYQIQLGKPYSEVRLMGPNGYGAVNTNVRRFQSVNSQIGEDITYTDDSNLGAYFTINTPGIYAIKYSDGKTEGASYILEAAITINAATFTGAVDLLPFSELIDYAEGAVNVTGLDAVSFYLKTSDTLNLQVGDIIRAQGTGSDLTTGDQRCSFSITRVA